MSKYFKEEETQKLKLSEYLTYKDSDFKYLLCDKEKRIPRTKYIIEILRDVEMDMDTYKLFISEFQKSGGRYDVRTKRETIKGIYKLLQKYPFLSSDALEEIWSAYIHDQFEEYALDEVLGGCIELYGKTDEAFTKYMSLVDKTAKEFDQKFIEETKKLDKYYIDYDCDLIDHLKYIIKSQHILAKKIIDSLPSKELIAEDKKQLYSIIESTRIYFGACYPISYQMIEMLATRGDLDSCPEKPQYCICGTTRIDATFTKQEFLDSIKERLGKEEKQKVLKK